MSRENEIQSRWVPFLFFLLPRRKGLERTSKSDFYLPLLRTASQKSMRRDIRLIFEPLCQTLLDLGMKSSFFRLQNSAELSTSDGFFNVSACLGGNSPDAHCMENETIAAKAVDDNDAELQEEMFEAEKEA